MRQGTLSPQSLLDHMQVPGETPGTPLENIYALGCFESRVTLYSQQVRALNLAYALFERKRLTPGSQVAIIGAGAGGLTAACALAYLGASVHLLEQADVLLPLQTGCRTRWIHPHIYDWPEPGSEDNEAALPLVNWTAGYAHDVASTLREAFERLSNQFPDRIRLVLSADVSTVAPGKPPRVSWQGRSPAGVKDSESHKAFDAVIVAVGFGVEQGTDDLPMSSYWHNDDLDQPVFRPQPDPIRCLVSGNSDGGLIEALRVRIRNFRLEALHSDLRATLNPSELERLITQLRECERNAGEQTDAWLWAQYRQYCKELPKELTHTFQKSWLRNDTRLWLAAARAPIAFRSAILNRFWVAMLVQHDDATKWVESATKSVAKDAKYGVVTFVNQAATVNIPKVFERVIIRHGPTSALTGPLAWIAERCRPVLKPRNALDETRWPIWKANETFGSPRSSFGVPVVLSQTLAANEPAVRVSRANAPPFVTGRGVTPAIQFVAHCRVDPESVKSVASSAVERVPELRWHATLMETCDLVFRSAKRLDDLVKLFPWFERNSDRRHLEVPAFKRSFFDSLDALQRAQAEIEQGLQSLWRYLAGVEILPRATALQTFASLASLRMIYRLRAFEGLLRTDDGRGIVNLFPDLPPIKSSWLLRRIPYRSRIGGLALNEERFLLCRVGATEQNYAFFLLPQWIAELNQDVRTGVSEEVFFRWIVPQWFFQGYQGDPGALQIVWVLLDEYGRERWSAASQTPWGRVDEIEEEPHPAISAGAEMHEIKPGWNVLTFPLEANSLSRSQPSTRSPLLDRKILWVDDNPEDNLFEVKYLEEMGANVSFATSTETAISLIGQTAVDLIVSDLHRVENGQDQARAGIDLQDRLKEVGDTTPIIFYTGDRSDGPPAIRPVTADQPAALFKLVLQYLR